MYVDVNEHKKNSTVKRKKNDWKIKIVFFLQVSTATKTKTAWKIAVKKIQTNWEKKKMMKNKELSREQSTTKKHTSNLNNAPISTEFKIIHFDFDLSWLFRSYVILAQLSRSLSLWLTACVNIRSLRIADENCESLREHTGAKAGARERTHTRFILCSLRFIIMRSRFNRRPNLDERKRERQSDG